jgi:hypothetical protein
MFWSRAAFGIALAAALVAGLLWLNGARTYDEVGAGSGSTGGGRKLFRDGDRVHLGTHVRNDGGRSVKIVEVAGGDVDVLKLSRVSMEPREGAGNSRLVPFSEFELEPGHERFVRADFRIRSCRNYENHGTTVAVDSLPVRYRTVFFERDADIRLGSPLVLAREGRCSG